MASKNTPTKRITATSFLTQSNQLFDVIALASKRVANLPFKNRFEKFDEVKTLMEKHDVGTIKTFIKLAKDTYGKQIKEFYDIKRAYHIDGLIFTPEGEYYKVAVKQRKNKYERIYNSDYSTTVSFKWKPLDQLTIDFYLMKHASKKDTYIIKYSIKRAFSSDELTDNDQAIDVLLPFSGAMYYREYLVNYDYVQKVFEANHFKLVKTDGFGSLLRSYKKQNARGYN
ncbi:putative mRNA-capping enzyme [Phytophthora ramorum]|uniref:putative mRNA-capping enzyme n=1 Tax=Phytophthora ramorum TaxID=164328 RepID=UPI00309E28FF|nr:putative mRNA-capping enzyme [Phytophthora ramorum]